MKERPIIFSGPMVRAILEGRKTQTRRIVKPQPSEYAGGVHPKNKPRHDAPYFDSYCNEKKTASNPRGMSQHWCWWTEDDRQGPDWIKCHYGQPGDRLWVRETWFDNEVSDDGSADETPKRCVYRADGEFSKQFPGDYVGTKWRPSIHMPRWASRITLEITDIRVERLGEISREDVIAEGAPPSHPSIDCVSREFGYEDFSRSWFAQLWESIHGAGSWAANPWVWVIEFQRVGGEE